MIIKSDFNDFKINSESTLISLFSERASRFMFIIYTKMAFITMLIGLGSCVLTSLCLSNILKPHYSALSLALGVVGYTPLISLLNIDLCKLVVKRFEFWYSFILGIVVTTAMLSYYTNLIMCSSCLYLVSNTVVLVYDARPGVDMVTTKFYYSKPIGVSALNILSLMYFTYTIQYGVTNDTKDLSINIGDFEWSNSRVIVGGLVNSLVFQINNLYKLIKGHLTMIKGSLTIEVSNRNRSNSESHSSVRRSTVVKMDEIPESNN